MRIALLVLVVVSLLGVTASAAAADNLKYCQHNSVSHGGYSIGFNTRVTSCVKAKEIVSRKVRGRSTGPYRCRKNSNPIFAYSYTCKAAGGRRIYTYDRNAGE